MMMALIPLDERPVNTRYPAMLAAAAGIDLRMPKPELLSAHKRRADRRKLGEWLNRLAPAPQAVIVSVEMLGYGSLIASRTSSDSVYDILDRLELLRQLKRQRPELLVLGFNTIMRISDFDGDVEEPEYWSRHGRQLFALSQLMDRALQGEPVHLELHALEHAVPNDVRNDFLRRRSRNHLVNLAMLQQAADGVFDTLVLSSDDTSPHGLPSREKRWLQESAGRLALGQRLLMYPGADEVGCALLARAANRAAGWAPTVEVAYYPAEGADIVAAYEDGPVRVTVERQIHAMGGVPVAAGGEIWMAVNAPLPGRNEYADELAARQRDERLATLTRLAHDARRRLQAGQRVAIADVAYPNGADPVLIEALLPAVDLTQLAAYGAWNTAGNTIGVALAQASLTRAGDEAARLRFLLHRFVEDWGYQRVVRAELRAQRTAGVEPSAAERPQALKFVERRLNALLERLPGFAGHWRIAPGSTRFPWQRTFEIDFDLERS